MSNIGKRFAKPAEWEQPHFTELNLKQRLFWLFLNNRCDLAGVYQLHFPVDSAYVGFTINQQFVDDFAEAINSDSKRIEQLKGRRLWLTNFIRYQQVGQKRRVLSAKAPPHISIVNKLKEHGLLSVAIENDPKLFSEFTGEVIENDDSVKPTFTASNYPNVRVSLDKPKGYSSSNSKSTCNGSSHNHSNSPPASNVDKAINPKPSLYYSNMVKDLKKIIPGNSIGVTNEVMESDVKTIIENLESNGVKNPESYMIDLVNQTNWQEKDWDTFLESLTNGALEDVPS